MCMGSHCLIGVMCALYDMIYLLTAFRLTPGGNSTVHIFTQKHIEQHNETEYTEQNIHYNKNT